MKKLLQLLFLCCFAFTSSFAQSAGDVFTAFGTNGKVNTNIGQADFIVKSQAVQTDGKIIMGGTIENSSEYASFLLRLNADGSLDTSFNSGGKIFISEMENIVKITLQNDGKIVVGGSYDFDVVLKRFNTNGTIDTTFGTNGSIINTSTGASRSLQDFVIQADGKFLVLSDFYSGSQDYRVLRYNSNGTPDTSFGNNGSITTDIGNVEFAKNILTQSDGKFIVAGTTLTTGTSTTSVFLARYNSNGTFDTSFNSNGKKTLTYTGFNEFYNFEFQTDGKIVLVFSSYVSSVPKLNVVKLNANSTLDTTFGTNGVANVTAPNNFGNGLKKFKIQSDGKLFIMSATFQMVNNSSNNNFLLVRLNANATYDTSFNGTGYQEFSFFANNDTGGDFSLIGNQILLSGNTEETLILNKIAIAKFNSTGSLDLSFDGDGKAFYTFPYTAYDESKCSAIQADGKIIVAGTSHFNQNSILSACRYNVDGSIDTTFGTSGFFKLNTQLYDGINTIEVDANGKILLGLNNSATVIRLNNNGTFDSTFGSGGFAIITSTFSSVADIKILPDNSILVAGNIFVNSGTVTSTNFMLAKLNANGTLATTFGTNGITTLTSTANYDQLFLVDAQADGKIVTIGNFSNGTNNRDTVIFKTNANGILDTSFNTTGVFTIGIPNTDDVPVGLQIQNDGKILFAMNYELNNKAYVVRITPAGLVDSSFDSDGIIYLNTSLINSVGALKVLSNQQILVGGTKENTTADFTLLKYNSNGSLNTTFGTNGKVTSDFFNNHDVLSGLLISNDNYLIATGTTLSPTGFADFALAKYHLIDGLGIGGNTINKKVLFYPNPVQNVLELSDEVKAVVLFTLDGKQIPSYFNNNSITTDHLPKGMYIIQMQLSNDAIVTDKLIKN